MALVIADRVRETTSSAGTGTLTLTGAFSGFQPFSVIGNGNTTYYCIIDAAAGAWEVGIGTYTSSGNTLSRDTVLSSSNADALVPFAVGLKDVICTQPAERAVYARAAGTGLAVGATAFTANGVSYADSTSTLATSANMTFNGTRLTVADLADSGLTSGRVTYASTGGALVDSANLTFDGTTLTPNALTVTNAVTLNAGTANGVAYLNGSKVLTTGSALTFDGSQFDIPAGTAAAPSLSTPADPDTGVFFPAANQLAASVGGTEGLRLTSTGLGIGTSSPGARLVAAAANTAIASRGTAYLFSTNAMGANLGGQLSLGGSFTGTTETVFASIAGRKENGTDNDIGGYLQFSTTNVSLGNVERMRLDSSGNLGLGVTPSAWGGSARAFESLSGTALYNTGTGPNMFLGANHFYNGSNFIYKTTSSASAYSQVSGAHNWFTAPSGTAGNAISFTQAMTLDASGNLGLGITSPVGLGSGIATLDIGSTNGGGLRFRTSGNSAFMFANSSGIDLGTNDSVYLRFITAATERARIDSSGNFIQSAPSTAPSLTTNGQMVFNLTSNTNLRVSVRGSDGVTRTANITLA